MKKYLKSISSIIFLALILSSGMPLSAIKSQKLPKNVQRQLQKQIQTAQKKKNSQIPNILEQNFNAILNKGPILKLQIPLNQKSRNMIEKILFGPHSKIQFIELCQNWEAESDMFKNANLNIRYFSNYFAENYYEFINVLSENLNKPTIELTKDEIHYYFLSGVYDIIDSIFKIPQLQIYFLKAVKFYLDEEQEHYKKRNKIQDFNLIHTQIFLIDKLSQEQKQMLGVADINKKQILNSAECANKQLQENLAECFNLQEPEETQWNEFIGFSV